ncbi:MAG: endonuclease III domain-containing protein [Candidatus Woesearchaeota archaeon]
MKELSIVYSLLLKAYGKQGWWPLSKDGSHSLHHQGPPLNDNDRFEIMVGAILTQNTAWTNVEKALHNLSKEKLLDIQRMHNIDTDHLASLIRPSGYYNMKAKKLKNLTSFILTFKSLNGLFNKKNAREMVLSINGVGPETADSILLYAAEKPYFVIDAYTRRIFSRFIGKEFSTYDEWQAFFMDSLKHDVGMFKEYHALIVEHAKRHCRAKPLCEGCLLSRKCNHFKTS